jgi:signal transduction histidine kinase
MELYDIIRSAATNAMLVMLLFTLAQSRYRAPVQWAALAVIVCLNTGLNIWFYLQDDYTTLAKLDIVYFIFVGIVAKPLFRDRLMQWLFNCFMVMNIYAAGVILSFYLCHLLPYPNYAVTLLRVLLFGAAIYLFRHHLRPLYRQAAERWDVYLIVSAALFMNFAWYFFSGADVTRMLTENIAPLLLLILLAVLLYLAALLSLRKHMRETLLREEHLNIRADRELTRHRLALMDEAVRQMSIAQHDRRHFNNTLLGLLEQGEAGKAAGLIRSYSESLPRKPRSYCDNVPVNAAVSYYAELARQQDIRCDLRLDIPQTLDVDEMSLAITVSNLMENAITAVSALPAPERRLRLTAVYAGQLILECSNPFAGSVAFDEAGLPVSAKEGHGTGSRSVADFVRKCGGELVYEVKEGLFRVRIGMIGNNK